MIMQGNNINYKTFLQKVREKFARFEKTSYLCTRLQAKNRDLAQLVAHTSGGREVAGSSPVIPTERKSKPLIISSLDFFLRSNVVVLLAQAQLGLSAKNKSIPELCIKGVRGLLCNCAARIKSNISKRNFLNAQFIQHGDKALVEALVSTDTLRERYVDNFVHAIAYHHIALSLQDSLDGSHTHAAGQDTVAS